MTVEPENSASPTGGSKPFEFWASVIGTVAIGAGTLVAVVLSFRLDSVPGGSQSRFIGIVVISGFSLVVLLMVSILRNTLAVAASIIAAAVGAGLWIEAQFNTLTGVTFAIAITGVVVLMAVLVSQGDMATASKVKMRNALAASFASTYLVTVGLVVFYFDSRPELPKLTETLVTNFTVLVGIVIGFYFGGATVEKLSELRALSKPDTDAKSVQAVVREDAPSSANQ